MLELHRRCAAVAGVEQEPRLEAGRLGDVRRSALDVARAREELGWQAETPLDEGLRLTWDWLRSKD